LERSELLEVGKLRRLDGTAASLVRISRSITRTVPESTNASSSFTISPVKFLAPAGNSTTM